MQKIKVILIIATVVLLISMTVILTTIQKYTFVETTYIVEQGDSLWSIASNYCPDSMDLRSYIHKIQEENNIDSLIYPGQKLTVFLVIEE